MTACKVISNLVNKGELVGVLGSAGSEKVQGETQKKLDIITNEVFRKSNPWAGHLYAMASEEMDEIYEIPNQYPRGKYLLTFDPLDGSFSTDVNVSVGTIFSILRCPGERASWSSNHARRSGGSWAITPIHPGVSAAGRRTLGPPTLSPTPLLG